MAEVLSVEALTKRYGERLAVDDISFRIGQNEIVGLLGPNGAGKTTTISMILGVLQPTSGRITITGIDLSRNRKPALQNANFSAVYALVPGNLTVYENLRVFGLIYGVSNLTRRVERLIEEFDLRRFRNTKCGLLSSGEQTRVCLAKAMLNKPELLLLDEPTASLDPATAREVREQIRGLVMSGKTGVLWASHNMFEVEDVCDRVLFLSRGKILLEGDPRTLFEQHGKRSLEELFVAIAREPLRLGVG